MRTRRELAFRKISCYVGAIVPIASKVANNQNVIISEHIAHSMVDKLARHGIPSRKTRLCLVRYRCEVARSLTCIELGSRRIPFCSGIKKTNAPGIKDLNGGGEEG